MDRNERVQELLQRINDIQTRMYQFYTTYILPIFLFINSITDPIISRIFAVSDKDSVSKHTSENKLIWNFSLLEKGVYRYFYFMFEKTYADVLPSKKCLVTIPKEKGPIDFVEDMKQEVRNQELAMLQEENERNAMAAGGAGADNFSFSAANLPQFLQRIERQSERLLSNLENQENAENHENQESQEKNENQENAENAENAQNNEDSEKQASSSDMLLPNVEHPEVEEDHLEKIDLEHPQNQEEENPVQNNEEQDKNESSSSKIVKRNTKKNLKKKKKTSMISNFFNSIFRSSKTHQILEDEEENDENEEEITGDFEKSAKSSGFSWKQFKKALDKNFPKNFQISNVFENLWTTFKFLNFELSIFQFLGFILMNFQLLSLVMVPHLKWFGTFDFLRQFKGNGANSGLTGAPAIRNTGFASGGLLEAGGELVQNFFLFIYGLRTFKLQYLTFGAFGSVYEMEKLYAEGRVAEFQKMKLLGEFFNYYFPFLFFFVFHGFLDSWNTFLLYSFEIGSKIVGKTEFEERTRKIEKIQKDVKILCFE